MQIPRWFYDAAVWAAQPLVRRKLRRRGRAEPGYLEDIPERFGHYVESPARPEPEAGMPLVWIHAVSLGETRAAGLLLAALRQQWPGMRCLLTNGTATGRGAGRKILEVGDAQVWQPWDTRRATGAFLTHYRPDIGVLMETEVWPNLVRGCNDAGVPLVLANARLSERSYHRALKGGRLLHAAYAGLAAVVAQTEADLARLHRLGAPLGPVFGNLKFDAKPQPVAFALGRRWREAAADRSVIVLASSRDGEEAAFLDGVAAWRAAHARDAASGYEEPQWLIVPRHPQRFDAVVDLARSRGFSVSRRSAWSDTPTPADIWIGDSMGEMTAYYALAKVALLGGSFLPFGGQNLIEAAACACPIVMGPHTFNFETPAADALRFDAACEAADLVEGVERAAALVANEPLREVMGRACLIFARKYQGAAARTARAVAQCLEQQRTKKAAAAEPVAAPAQR